MSCTATSAHNHIYHIWQLPLHLQQVVLQLGTVIREAANQLCLVSPKLVDLAFLLYLHAPMPKKKMK